MSPGECLLVPPGAFVVEMPHGQSSVGIRRIMVPATDALADLVDKSHQAKSQASKAVEGLLKLSRHAAGARGGVAQ